MATYMTAPAVAQEWGCKIDHVYELAAREADPLPLRYEIGKVRSGFVIVDELNEWIARNTVQYRERRRK